MKHTTAILLAALIPYLTNCGNNQRYERHYNNHYDVTVAQQTYFASSGLDLQAVGGLVQQAKDGAHFEKLLNDQSRGINNLDLDENGEVDYIHVTEYGQADNRGFSLTVNLDEGETQEIATIDIEKTPDGKANIQTHGNSNIYGQDHYYHRSGIDFTDMLLLGWMFSGNRPNYHSGWGYRNYPPDYRRYSPRPYNDYQRDIRTKTANSGYKKSPTSTLAKATTSPNAGKTAKSIKAPLKNPTTAQKSFQARNPSKQVASGGFGRQGSTTKPSGNTTTSKTNTIPKPSSAQRTTTTSSSKKPFFSTPSRSTSPSKSSPSFRRSSFGGGSSFRGGK